MMRRSDMKRKFPNRKSKPQVCKLALRPATLVQFVERMPIKECGELLFAYRSMLTGEDE
jgi:hypothetical protein